MNSLQERSYEPELMDSPGTDRETLFKNLQELDQLNRYLGGHSSILEGVRKLTGGKSGIRVTDLGCGSGDTLRYLAEWARKKRLKFTFTGVDRNSDAIGYLVKHCRDFPEIKGVAADYAEFLRQTEPADIYLCSLFCHHLDNRQLKELFGYMKKASVGFVISDLHRSQIAYLGAWLLPRVLNGTSLSKNDGPVSVKKAFKRGELEKLLTDAGCTHVEIKRKWFFRYLVIVRTNKI